MLGSYCDPEEELWRRYCRMNSQYQYYCKAIYVGEILLINWRAFAIPARLV